MSVQRGRITSGTKNGVKAAGTLVWRVLPTAAELLLRRLLLPLLLLLHVTLAYKQLLLLLLLQILLSCVALPALMPYT
jgi:hypothetical protein